MPADTYDTLILGAGAAGLAAAQELARARVTALVVEARLHVGGRAWSHHERGIAVPVELGAEFIHGRAASTFAMLSRAGSAAVDAGGEHWTQRRGKLEPAGELFSEVQEAIARTRALDRRDLAFETFLERHLDPLLSPEASRFARSLAEGFDAADLTRASARAIVEEWSGAGSVGAAQFRPLGGYGPLLATLAGTLHGSSVTLQLGTIVHAVRWGPASVTIEGTHLGKPFGANARRAIVTLPLGVLQLPSSSPANVRFTPRLAQKSSALKRLAAGPVFKVVLHFRTPFWERIDRGRYADAAFFHAPDAAFPTFWTSLPTRTPMLVAWAAGPKAARLAGEPRERIVRAAFRSFESLFGRGARAERKLEGAWVHDWQSDPFACGAYSYVLIGGGGARETLAQPLLDTLFFAGEAADTQGEAGTVAGALQSGTRAARELLAQRRAPQSRKTAKSSRSTRGG